MVGLVSLFINEHHGWPALLHALLLGLTFHFLSRDARLRPGIDIYTGTVLRVSMALLGSRIGFDQIRSPGSSSVLLVADGVALTIVIGLLLSWSPGCRRDEGLVSGCTVGICSASAALAVASVLPPPRENERFTLLAAVGVTTLSTLVMLLYPMLVRTRGFSTHEKRTSFSLQPFTTWRRLWRPACQCTLVALARRCHRDYGYRNQLDDSVSRGFGAGGNTRQRTPVARAGRQHGH